MKCHLPASLDILKEVFSQNNHEFTKEFACKLVRGTLCVFLVIPVGLGIYDYYTAFRDLHAHYKKIKLSRQHPEFASGELKKICRLQNMCIRRHNPELYAHS